MNRRLSVGGDEGASRVISLQLDRPQRIHLIGIRLRGFVLKLLIVLIVIVVIVAFSLPSFSGVLNEELYPRHGPLSFRDAGENEACSWTLGSDEVRLAETKRILASVRRDLLNAARQLEAVNLQYESLSKQLADKKNELKAVQLEIEEAHLLQKELRDKNNVRVFLPLAPPQRSAVLDARLPRGSSLETAFDFSRCSVAGGFRLYVYDTDKTTRREIAQRYIRHFRNRVEWTEDASIACIFVAVVDEYTDVTSLQYFRSGTNHILLNIGWKPLVNVSNAMVISPEFAKSAYRNDFDIAMYLNVPEYSENEWQHLPQLLPYFRKYFLSYSGVPLSDSFNLKEQLESIAKSASESGDEVLFELNCTTSSEPLALCHDAEYRGALLDDSMFVLLFTSQSSDSSWQFQLRLLEALMHGAVPIVVSLSAPLPLSGLVDWRLATYCIAPQRLPELYFVLRSFAPSDVLEMRRKGRFFLQNYLANTKVIAATLMAAQRQRIGVPGAEHVPSPSVPLFGLSFISPRLVPAGPPHFEEEYLGPPEAPHNSPSFTHNFTSLQLYSSYLWNEFGASLGVSLEYLTVEPPFPSQTEFDDGASFGFRPISPGSGVEFSAAIGGNRPREQFTVLLLTYRRDSVLYASLERLNNLPYLNKVVVVWNNPEDPSGHAWPRLHVPVHFVKASNNSLNNRFIPYDQIETEAVLSLDDDIDLKQHEIIFAFRVWREQRTKVVGFPARHHARYGTEMFYNSNHTCQYSMILTGAAFIHKAYMYIYTYRMPEVIRAKVDELMNCEDLAMNFLVSHITRQPPIKTTSKWTLRCATCSEMLSQDLSHFTERHECIRFFTRVYGYNPLLFSQFRVDSVLFKTRLPPNHQKCFKYV
uniref:Exostosin-2 n=1 Tax=Ascaris suum TaxID=6253 RepID=F1KVP1_ASCSU